MSTRYFATAFAVACLCASQANAADLPSKAAPPVFVPPATLTWSGCYLGVQGGGSFARAHAVGLGLNNGVPIAIPAGTTKSDTRLSGALVGGTVGCSAEVNRFVLGIEGDGAWANAHGSSITLPPFNTNFSERPTQRSLGTARGRIGFLVVPSVQVYGTVGGAFSKLSIDERSRLTGIGADESHIFFGWTAGAGIEWMFAPNWSVKAEYLYVDLGKQNFFAATANGCCSFQSTRFRDEIVRGGINYHFNWTPAAVVARY